MTSPRRLRLTAGLALAALVGAVVWGLATYQDLQDRLDALPRTSVPGEVTFEVQDSQGMTVFYEDPDAATGFVVRSDQSSTVGLAPVDVAVTGPAGPVTLAGYERDLRFDVDGRVATALMTFDASEPGRYTLRAEGEVPTGAMVSAGDVVDGRLLASTAGVVGLFVASIVTAAVTGVLALVQGSHLSSRAQRGHAAGARRSP